MPRKKAQAVIKICERCGIEYIALDKVRGRRQRFCSLFCAATSNGKSNIGRKHTIAWKQLMSSKNSSAGNPFYGKKHTIETRKKISNANKGKKRSDEFKRRLRVLMTGENNPAKRLEVRLKISQRVKETHWDCSLEKSPSWRGGVSFLPYRPDKHLRKLINKLDGNICVLCGENREYIGLHHIDYDKLNNDIDNLCILCHSCNSKVNKGREFWQQFISKLVITRRKVSYGRHYRSNPQLQRQVMYP